MIGLFRRAVRRLLAGAPSRAAYKFAIKDWLPLFDLEAAAQVLETKRFTQNLKPLELECPAQRRILVIAPHPDDDVFGAGGTMIEAISKGAKVHVLYITDGENDPERARLIKEDAVRSCDAIGASPIFLGCQTGSIPLSDQGLNHKLTSLFAELDPQAIFIPFLLDDHDDHRRVNELFLSVARTLRLEKVEIWAYQVYSTVLPNVIVNITDHVERKREVIEMWHNVSGNRNWAHYVLGMNAANCRYLQSKEPEYVEAFFVVPIDEYLDLCEGYFSHGADRIYFTSRYREGSAHVEVTGSAPEGSQSECVIVPDKLEVTNGPR